MRELVKFWRRDGVRVLPYLDDFMFMKHGFAACARLARRMEGDFIKAVGLRINVPKCRTVPSQQRRQLGFEVYFAKGEFRVPEDRWEFLMASVGRVLDGRKKRVLLCTLASITGRCCPCACLGVL
jgi:hypothetical protein